jgi:hypothetical protein
MERKVYYELAVEMAILANAASLLLFAVLANAAVVSQEISGATVVLVLTLAAQHGYSLGMALVYRNLYREHTAHAVETEMLR